MSLSAFISNAEQIFAESSCGIATSFNLMSTKTDYDFVSNKQFDGFRMPGIIHQVAFSGFKFLLEFMLKTANPWEYGICQGMAPDIPTWTI